MESEFSGSNPRARFFLLEQKQFSITSGQGWWSPWSVPLSGRKKVSCGGVFDMAVKQPQLFRKLHQNQNQKKKKYFALIYFTEVVMNAKQSQSSKIGCCPLTLRNSPLQTYGGPITALQPLYCHWSLNKFINVNFSKLTESNQIFRIGFVFIHYQLCEILSQIIECKFLVPYDLVN